MCEEQHSWTRGRAKPWASRGPGDEMMSPRYAALSTIIGTADPTRSGRSEGAVSAVRRQTGRGLPVRPVLLGRREMRR